MSSLCISMLTLTAGVIVSFILGWDFFKKLNLMKRTLMVILILVWLFFSGWNILRSVSDNKQSNSNLQNNINSHTDSTSSTTYKKLNEKIKPKIIAETNDIDRMVTPSIYLDKQINVRFYIRTESNNFAYNLRTQCTYIYKHSGLHSNQIPFYDGKRIDTLRDENTELVYLFPKINNLVFDTLYSCLQIKFENEYGNHFCEIIIYKKIPNIQQMFIPDGKEIKTIKKYLAIE